MKQHTQIIYAYTYVEDQQFNSLVWSSLLLTLIIFHVAIYSYCNNCMRVKNYGKYVILQKQDLIYVIIWVF